MTYPSHSDAIELLEYIFEADIASVYATHDRFEAFFADISVEDAEKQIAPFLSARGIDEGIEVLPDTLDGMEGIPCALVRITLKGRVQ